MVKLVAIVYASTSDSVNKPNYTAATNSICMHWCWHWQIRWNYSNAIFRRFCWNAEATVMPAHRFLVPNQFLNRAQFLFFVTRKTICNLPPISDFIIFQLWALNSGGHKSLFIIHSSKTFCLTKSRLEHFLHKLIFIFHLKGKYINLLVVLDVTPHSWIIVTEFKRYLFKSVQRNATPNAGGIMSNQRWCKCVPKKKRCSLNKTVHLYCVSIRAIAWCEWKFPVFTNNYFRLKSSGG